MTPHDLAKLHARCFETPRPWSETEFTNLLASSSVTLYSTVHGFLLGRIAGPEAELLTLAVDPKTRRAGDGTRLLAEFEADAGRRGATDVYLEVASDNAAARALYASTGYTEAGVRPGYYQRPDGTRVDALVLRKPLGRS